jgi:hypothetical protein
VVDISNARDKAKMEEVAADMDRETLHGDQVPSHVPSHHRHEWQPRGWVARERKRGRERSLEPQRAVTGSRVGPSSAGLAPGGMRHQTISSAGFLASWCAAQPRGVPDPRRHATRVQCLTSV